MVSVHVVFKPNSLMLFFKIFLALRNPVETIDEKSDKKKKKKEKKEKKSKKSDKTKIT